MSVSFVKQVMWPQQHYNENMKKKLLSDRHVLFFYEKKWSPCFDYHFIFVNDCTLITILSSFSYAFLKYFCFISRNNFYAFAWKDCRDFKLTMLAFSLAYLISHEIFSLGIGIGKLIQKSKRWNVLGWGDNIVWTLKWLLTKNLFTSIFARISVFCM